MPTLRDGWGDVEPVPQDDGPNPVVAINYAPEFREAMDLFRAVLKSGERSKRALLLTAEVVEMNPANYTAWQYRRRCLEALKSDLVSCRDKRAFVVSGDVGGGRGILVRIESRISCPEASEPVPAASRAPSRNTRRQPTGGGAAVHRGDGVREPKELPDLVPPPRCGRDAGRPVGGACFCRERAARGRQKLPRMVRAHSSGGAGRRAAAAAG